MTKQQQAEQLFEQFDVAFDEDDSKGMNDCMNAMKRLLSFPQTLEDEQKQEITDTLLNNLTLLQLQQLEEGAKIIKSRNRTDPQYKF